MLAGPCSSRSTFALPGIGSLLVESVDGEGRPDGAGARDADRRRRSCSSTCSSISRTSRSTRGSRFGEAARVSDVAALDRAADARVGRAAAARRRSASCSLLRRPRSSSSSCAVFGRAVAPHDPNAQNLLVSSPARARALAGHGRPRPRHLLADASSARAPRSLGPLIVALGAMLIGNALGLARRLHGRLARHRRSCASSTSMYALPGLLVAIVVVGVVGGGYWARGRAARRALLAVRHAHRPRRDAGAARAAVRRGGAHARAAARGGSWSGTSGRTCCRSSSRTRSSTSRSRSSRSPALSFLGLGVGPGTRRLGTDARREPRRCSSRTRGRRSAPAIAIVLIAAAMNLVGDWIYERLSDRGTGCGDRAARSTIERPADRVRALGSDRRGRSSAGCRCASPPARRSGSSASPAAASR